MGPFSISPRDFRAGVLLSMRNPIILGVSLHDALDIARCVAPVLASGMSAPALPHASPRAYARPSPRGMVHGRSRKAKGQVEPPRPGVAVPRARPMRRNNPRLGITLMILTSLVFALQDGVSRYLASNYHVI